MRIINIIESATDTTISGGIIGVGMVLVLFFGLLAAATYESFRP